MIYILNNQGLGNCYQPSRRPRLITLTSTLIIPDITKTSSNNCLLFSNESEITVSKLCISCCRVNIYHRKGNDFKEKTAIEENFKITEYYVTLKIWKKIQKKIRVIINFKFFERFCNDADEVVIQVHKSTAFLRPLRHSTRSMSIAFWISQTARNLSILNVRKQVLLFRSLTLNAILILIVEWGCILVF